MRILRYRTGKAAPVLNIRLKKKAKIRGRSDNARFARSLNKRLFLSCKNAPAHWNPLFRLDFTSKRWKFGVRKKKEINRITRLDSQDMSGKHLLFE